MGRMGVFVMKGKDMTRLSKQDLVICFICAELEVMGRDVRDGPNEKTYSQI